MKKSRSVKTLEPMKDDRKVHRVATVWRPTLEKMVSCLVRSDYRFQDCDPFIKAPTRATSKYMQRYVDSYGETLAEVPEATWRSSDSVWEGPFWEVFISLWTIESGESDMVLHVRITPTKSGGYRYEPLSVYVP